jgi:hypothetical protein
MNRSRLLTDRMTALAFLHERMLDCPEWLRRLTPEQVHDLADLMVQWQPPSPLAFLYDRMRNCPDWLRRLTPGQIEDVADLIARWSFPTEGNQILPLEEIERRELLRAVTLCQGNVIKAAKALEIGKTTIYKKLRVWGYTVKNRILLAQASVLGSETNFRGLGLGKTIPSPRNESVNSSHRGF